MNPDTAAALQQLQSTIGLIVAVVGVVGSAAGTVIGTRIGVKWLREWVHDLDEQVTRHGERISKIEGICEERRAQPGKC